VPNVKIVAAKKILRANEQLAAENRQRLAAAGVYCVNLVGSPGSGKTTLLEAVFTEVPATIRPAVIEGDLASQIDADRIEQLGVPVVQINTEGMCHLDATMVGAAAEGFDLDAVNMLVVENVGNLVCTANYDLGEHLRLVILSVPEGDDKIAKYPPIFQRSDVLVISKVDLLPHFNFDVARVRADMRQLSPDAPVFQVSARTGEGMNELVDWLSQRCRKKRSGP
jgi:hydrogenase nickel incorporation protein HypB